MNDRFKFRVWAKPHEPTQTEGYYVDDADYGWYYHKEFEDYCSISQEWIGKKEIIGNIHENPELLEQSNDD